MAPAPVSAPYSLVCAVMCLLVCADACLAYVCIMVSLKVPACGVRLLLHLLLSHNH
jgi:hypothetical protein